MVVLGSWIPRQAYRKLRFTVVVTEPDPQGWKDVNQHSSSSLLRQDRDWGFVERWGISCQGGEGKVCVWSGFKKEGISSVVQFQAIWLPREDYEITVLPRAHGLSLSRWPLTGRMKASLTVHTNPEMGELLWRTGATLVRWCHWPGRKPKEKHFFLRWDSCSISPAACSLEWHPKLWPQATRPWGWAFLEPLEQLGIESVHTSGMCSWIQNFPMDSGTWQSVGTVGIDSVWRGYSPYFFKWCFLLINTCSPRQRRSLCSTQAKRARSRLSWMNKPSVAGPDVCQPWDEFFCSEESSEQQDVIRNSWNKLASPWVPVASLWHSQFTQAARKAGKKSHAHPLSHSLSPTSLKCLTLQKQQQSFVEYLLSAKNFIYIGSLNLYKNPVMYDSCSDLKQRKRDSEILIVSDF